MISKKTSRILIAGAALAAVVAGTAAVQSAFAVTQSNGSQGPVLIGNAGTGAAYAAGTTFAWNTSTFGYTDSASTNTPFVCPSDATGVVKFVAPTGSEFTKTLWSATGSSSFATGTTGVVTPSFQLTTFNVGSIATVKANGGAYSVGLACTINNGGSLASTGVWFASYTIATGGAGAYTVAQPSAAATPSASASPSGSQSVTLKATTVNAEDGVLSLSAPANALVTFGTAVVSPTTHLSTSTGALGNITVQDGRALTHRGWDLTSSVSDFVNDANSALVIPKAQLGFAPSIVSQPSGSVITQPAAKVAGTSALLGTFASADSSSTVGDTVLNAALTFVSPASAAAGTYASTLTLTLVSK